jgi:hypothetical protein
MKVVTIHKIMQAPTIRKHLFMVSAETNLKLSNEQLSFFDKNGYLVMPQYLNPTHCKELKQSVDNLLIARKKGEKPLVISEKPLGHLVSHEETMAIGHDLLGKDFVLHHIHADRHEAGKASSFWHQDYEQEPQRDRKYAMFHVFYYLSGLNGEIGDLLVLPGSHKTVTQNSLAIFEDHDLPGYLAFDNLPAGSAVFVHSALFHARRAKSGGENNPRYFVDCSYCQKGPLWPANSRNREISEYALSAGYDKGGKYAHLFDFTQFIGQASLNEKQY